MISKCNKLCWLAQNLFNVTVRVWLFYVFFMSALTKVQSFESTKALFQYEYAVPFIDPIWAAYLGTGAELVLPVLVLLGIMTPLSALGLFIFNYIAVISYPDISAAGIKDHMLWGFMCAYLIAYGAQCLSFDGWCCRKKCHTTDGTQG